MTEPDLTRIRVCDRRCGTCIFSPGSPITAERRRDYEASWRRRDTFQNCHHGTMTGDRALMCRGFYDWCKKVGWEPLAIQLGERLGRLDFVPVPDIDDERLRPAGVAGYAAGAADRHPCRSSGSVPPNANPA